MNTSKLIDKTIGELIFMESQMVLTPVLATDVYWLFDTLWKYETDQESIEIYSTITGYGSTINNKKTHDVVEIRRSMSSKNIAFLSKEQINEICNNTKNKFISNMLLRNVTVVYGDNPRLQSATDYSWHGSC